MRVVETVQQQYEAQHDADDDARKDVDHDDTQ
jgi:hypothetical protein